MKKILLTSVICSSILFGASNPSVEYNYEVSLFTSGILSNSKAKLKDDNYPNLGISLAKNFSSFINQIEVSYMRSSGLSYKGTGETYINRLFLNAIKYLPINEKFKFYGLVGAGYQNVTLEWEDHKDSPLLNYGVGMKYDLPYYGIALKSDIRHLYATKNQASDFMYTLALAMPLGEKDVSIVPTMQTFVEPTPIVDGDDDRDGVPNSIDRCPDTPAGVKVNEYGCEPDDDDGDGISNKLDKCPDTSEGVKVNQDGCVDTVDLKINFEYNSSVVREKYMHEVKKFAELMKANPKLTAKIEAHTDSIGSDQYNMKLSDERAASASLAIEKQGIKSSRIKSIGYGESQPIASNDTAEGRAENRRVIGLLNQ